MSARTDFESVGNTLLKQRWIFAKTMPQNPHEYTLRREWSSDAEFVQVVEYIRARGYKAIYQGRPYMQLDVNDHFYWTMGAPLGETILINRKVKPQDAPYDKVAAYYDGLFTDAASDVENRAVMTMLGDLSDKRVLDVGCGTGLLLDYARPGGYTGIDPSGAMLALLHAKHPEYAGQTYEDRIRERLDALVDDPAVKDARIALAADQHLAWADGLTLQGSNIDTAGARS